MSWNYTTWLNIVFLAIAVVLVARFVTSGGLPMLRMMGGSPNQNPATTTTEHVRCRRIGAGAVEVDLVGDLGEAVLLGELTGEAFDVVDGEPDGEPALPAQQVVSMLGRGAQPIQHLAVLGALGFHHLQAGERVQDAVHGHQSDPDAVVLAKLEMQLLGTTEAVAALQQVQHGSLLGGHARAV